jgi:hypothetical protein
MYTSVIGTTINRTVSANLSGQMVINTWAKSETEKWKAKVYIQGVTDKHLLEVLVAIGDMERGTIFGATERRVSATMWMGRPKTAPETTLEM